MDAMLSRTACSPSAFLAPFLPSARNSSARFFIAARSAALKPSDLVCALLAGIFTQPFDAAGPARCRPSEARLGPMTPRSFSIPDRIGNQGDGQVAAPRAEPTLTGWWSKSIPSCALVSPVARRPPRHVLFNRVQQLVVRFEPLDRGQLIHRQPAQEVVSCARGRLPFRERGRIQDQFQVFADRRAAQLALDRD